MEVARNAKKEEETQRLIPFFSRIKERTLLNKKGSTKETYHLVLDLSFSDIEYKVGDSLGIYPSNSEESVCAILASFGVAPEELIEDHRTGERVSLEEFLQFRVDLARISSLFASRLRKWFGKEVDRKEEDLLGILEKYDLRGMVCKEEISSLFTPLLPRFYSIASSPLVSPKEAHLLVSNLRYLKNGKVRRGIGSYFLCESARLQKTPVPIYLQSTPHFTLPKDPGCPILMIGPGTGVAPYRGFLEHRYQKSSPGKNWLIFGERHRSFDYYYQSFFENLEEKGFLRLSTAFSRDQKEKHYVQHSLKKHQKEVWDWIDRQGATLYICGDKRAMAKQVVATLQEIAEEQGSMTPERAKAYMKLLRMEKRLLLDVY